MHKFISQLIPVSEEVRIPKVSYGPNVFAHQITCVNPTEAVDLSLYSFAILGIVKGKNELNTVRSVFYEMFAHETGLILDLGDLLESACDKLPEIFDLLHKYRITCAVVSLGLDHQSVSCFMKHSSKEAFQTVSSLLPAISIQSVPYLQSLLTEKNAVFNANLLCYQQYISDPNLIKKFGSAYFSSKRLGEVRADIRSVEPALRDTHILLADLLTVRSSDLTNCTNNPNGLYAEEFCQLMYFAGLSDKLERCLIFTAMSIANNLQLSTFVAQSIWYLYNGSQHRIEENLLKSVNGIKKIVVELDTHKQQLVFYFSELSDRWWIEVECDNAQNTVIFACSFDDYRKASLGDVPLIWLWYQQKLRELDPYI